MTVEGIPLLGAAYLAAEGLEEQLEGELRGTVTSRHGRLLFTDRGPISSVWAQNVWCNPVRYAMPSIGEGARTLTAQQRNWWPYAASHHRRVHLVAGSLPYVGAKPLSFPTPAKTATLGSFTLLDATTLVAASSCTSPFPNGEARFVEDHVNPPSRAYLKLYEALTLLGVVPKPEERCLEIGAAPGSWTWVLAKLGTQVIAYDRAPLAPHVLGMPGITARLGDAFVATPETVGPIDWLFSDIICYPERLVTFLRSWIDANAVSNIVATIKFQGQEHYGVIPILNSIPGARLLHLFHNKHELTLLWTRATARTSGSSC